MSDFEFYVLIILTLILHAIAFITYRYIWIECRSKRKSKSDSTYPKYLRVSPMSFRMMPSEDHKYYIVDDKMEYYLFMLVVDSIPLFDSMSGASDGMSVYEPDVSRDTIDRLNVGQVYFQSDESGKVMVRDKIGIISIHDDFKSASESYIKLRLKH